MSACKCRRNNFRSALMKALDKGVETWGPESYLFKVPSF